MTALATPSVLVAEHSAAVDPTVLTVASGTMVEVHEIRVRNTDAGSATATIALQRGSVQVRLFDTATTIAAGAEQVYSGSPVYLEAGDLIVIETDGSGITGKTVISYTSSPTTIPGFALKAAFLDLTDDSWVVPLSPTSTQRMHVPVGGARFFNNDSGGLTAEIRITSDSPGTFSYDFAAQAVASQEADAATSFGPLTVGTPAGAAYQTNLEVRVNTTPAADAMKVYLPYIVHEDI